ncbi:hypothetical protein VP01_2728g5 [Puccinia sorghi]|uniref:Uncharacterized protein n=1 Tax=Puccinia sorghi TaxID=27349 RepID=A0A0L6V3C2_9BASI|nr:hypothetical protein VP01_2728g5 [Puccinia sorghi]
MMGRSGASHSQNLMILGVTAAIFGGFCSNFWGLPLQFWGIAGIMGVAAPIFGVGLTLTFCPTPQKFLISITHANILIFFIFHAAQKIKAKLLAMNTTQREIQFGNITKFIEGSGTVVNIQSPKKATKHKEVPKVHEKKPKSTTTRKDPSHFDHLGRKNKADDQREEPQKKKKKDPGKPKQIQTIRKDQIPLHLQRSSAPSKQ